MPAPGSPREACNARTETVGSTEPVLIESAPVFVHLAPLAGRGRILREAKNPGEGDSLRIRIFRICGDSPSPQPSPRKSGARETNLNALRSGRRLDRLRRRAHRQSNRAMP